MSTSAPGTTPHYYVPAPSRHPAFAAFGLFFIIFGAANWINGQGWAMWVMLFGFLWQFGVLYQWFRDAIGESQSGLYGRKIDLSFR